jgi:hypothetical protein
VSCFQLVEKKLRDGTIYDAAHNNDSELLALVLFSGFLDSSDAGPAVYPRLFSYLCYLIGHPSREFASAMVGSSKLAMFTMTTFKY